MARNTRIFSDLDFNFAMHPISGDVTSRYDDNAIKQSIRNLILTKPFERPFRSNISSPVSRLLFDNMNPMTTSMLKRTIEETILNHEPRVDVLEVRVAYQPDANTVYVSITYKIKNTQTPVTIDLFLERTR